MYENIYLGLSPLSLCVIEYTYNYTQEYIFSQMVQYNPLSHKMCGIELLCDIDYYHHIKIWDRIITNLANS